MIKPIVEFDTNTRTYNIIFDEEWLKENDFIMTYNPNNAAFLKKTLDGIKVKSKINDVNIDSPVKRLWRKLNEE